MISIILITGFWSIFSTFLEDLGIFCLFVFALDWIVCYYGDRIMYEILTLIYQTLQSYLFLNVLVYKYKTSSVSLMV